MSILAPVLRRAFSVEGPYPLTSETLIGLLAGPGTASGRRVTKKTALGVSPVWAAVRLIAETIGSLPLHVYERLPNGNRRIATEHPLYPLLHDVPNPNMTSFQLRETAMGHVLLGGNAFLFTPRSGVDGRPRSLQIMRPDCVVEIAERSDGTLLYKYATRSGTIETLAQDQVCHLRGFSDDGIIGYDPVALHSETVGLALAAQEYGARFFGQGARPGGVLETKTRLSPEAAKRLSQSWNEAHSGLANAHKVAVLEDGVAWKPVGMTQADAQYKESRTFETEELARIFHVPPHKIADLSRSTFCLPSTERVFTEYGPKSIAEVRAGERVWSRDGDAWVLETVEASACQGFDEILTITTGFRTIRCNARHKIPVRRRVLRPWTGGRGKHVMVDGAPHRVCWETITIPAGEIVIGDQLLALSELPDSGRRDCPTRPEASVELMECLGMLLGDGFYAGTNGYDTMFGFSHAATDEAYIEYYRQAFAVAFTQQPGPGQSLAEPIPLVAHERDPFTTVFYSAAARRELAELGVEGGSKTKRVPSWVFGVAHDLQLAILRGYLDADGTVDKHGRLRFVSVNRDLLEGMQYLAMAVGLCPGRIWHSDIQSDFGTGKQYEHRLYGFVCGRPDLNLRLGSHTPWYIERMEQAQRRAPRRTAVAPYEQRQREAAPGVRHSEVVAIQTEAIHQPVYNISVTRTHTMIASGVYTHQSNIEKQGGEFVVDTIRPWCERLEQQFGKDLLLASERRRFYIEFDIDGLLRGDIATRYAAYGTGRQWSFLTPNDIRRNENMDPLPNGDVAHVPVNMVRLGDEALSTALDPGAAAAMLAHQTAELHALRARPGSDESGGEE